MSSSKKLMKGTTALLSSVYLMTVAAKQVPCEVSVKQCTCAMIDNYFLPVENETDPIPQPLRDSYNKILRTAYWIPGHMTWSDKTWIAEELGGNSPGIIPGYSIRDGTINGSSGGNKKARTTIMQALMKEENGTWFLKGAGGLYHVCGGFGGKTVSSFDSVEEALSYSQEPLQRRRSKILQRAWLPERIAADDGRKTSESHYEGLCPNHRNNGEFQEGGELSYEDVKEANGNLKAATTGAASDLALDVTRWDHPSFMERYVDAKTRVGPFLVKMEDVADTRRMTFRLHGLVVEEEVYELDESNIPTPKRRYRFFVHSQDGVVQLSSSTHSYLTNVSANRDLELKMLFSTFIKSTAGKQIDEETIPKMVQSQCRADSSNRDDSKKDGNWFFQDVLRRCHAIARDVMRKFVDAKQLDPLVIPTSTSTHLYTKERTAEQMPNLNGNKSNEDFDAGKTDLLASVYEADRKRDDELTHIPLMKHAMVLGIDFMLGSDGSAWLLEVNSCPAVRVWEDQMGAKGQDVVDYFRKMLTGLQVRLRPSSAIKNMLDGDETGMKTTKALKKGTIKIDSADSLVSFQEPYDIQKEGNVDVLEEAVYSEDPVKILDIHNGEWWEVKL